MIAATPLLCLAVSISAALVLGPGSFGATPTAADKISSDCTFRGKKLQGKVKIVSAFPDFKVKKVEAFEDLKVKNVDAFPDSCGRWQFVDSFPDFTIQYVEAFPDFTIRFVNAFPGL